MSKRPRTLKGHVLFQILTKAIYTTFTRAIKEAVSNAYDAGANIVEITFDPPTFLKDQAPSELTIQIRDDGKGMSQEDFWERFASIDSEKDPTKKDPTTGRFPIGKFGIGSFALVPFSLGLTIFSRKFNEAPIRCVIHTDKLMEKTSDDFPDHVSKSIKDQKISVDEWETVFGSTDSGTVIVIQGITKE
ncbi:MAG TPA: ATP-binding protein, partial [Pirellulales bacterium]|nr:ATP-binding protein [Pirellulales bacterium]